MNKSGIGCVVLFVLSFILGVSLYKTCPTTADHRAVLGEAVSEVIDTRLTSKNDDLMSKVLEIVGKETLDQTSNLVISQLLHVDNYYFFSVGRIRYKNMDHMVSVGVFGHVFAPDKEDLEMLLNTYGI